ncbi:MAG: substrate-binding domain-containing protein [Bacteroidota bacterium]
MKSIINLNDPNPLYQQIERALKTKIEKGELKPGDQLGSQQELAAEYNVSLITVKKALANLIKQGVLYSRVGKGTFVAEKSAVKKIGTVNNKTIGLVLNDINHSYFSMIVHSIEERAYELGFNILLSNSSGSIEKEESQIEHFRKMGVDGLIIASLSGEYRATEYLQTLHKQNFPYIMISYIHDPEYWYVGSDNELGGFIATEHLIKSGYESIGYVHVGKGNLLSEVRKNGYYRALMEYGKPYSSDFIYYLDSNKQDIASERFQLGKNFCHDFAKLEKKPQALLFFEDMVALGFIAESKENNMKIPGDVAVVGYDDVHISRYTSVPLTTVHQPIDSIGKMAVEIIQKRIDGTDIGNRTVLKPTLIIRESCGSKKKSATESKNISAK